MNRAINAPDRPLLGQQGWEHLPLWRWTPTEESDTEATGSIDASTTMGVILQVLGTMQVGQKRFERQLKEALAVLPGSAISYAPIAEDYCARLAEIWPEADVYYREEPDLLCIAVIGGEWDGQKEYDAYHLRGTVWPDDDGSLFVDVEVFFEDDAVPNLAGYTRLHHVPSSASPQNRKRGRSRRSGPVSQS